MRWLADTPVDFTVHKPHDRTLQDEATDVLAAVYWSRCRGAVIDDAKPSHRAYTLTDRTLALARRVAALVSAATDRGDGHLLAGELTRAIMHAQGMPEVDLRRMATWVRERCSDPDLVAIADATLANLAVDAMPVGSVDVRGNAAEILRVSHDAQVNWANRATKAERALDKATEVAQNWKDRLDDREKMVIALSLSLRRIEAISHGIAPSTVHEAPEPMPVEVADALVSRLLSQFIEFGTVSDALASGRRSDFDDALATIRDALDKAGARIKQLERDLADAAKARALVGATETLVRRMIDRLVETDPEWVDSLRKSGS